MECNSHIPSSRELASSVDVEATAVQISISAYNQRKSSESSILGATVIIGLCQHHSTMTSRAFPPLQISAVQLNLDVLDQICEFLTDTRDVLSFSVTCSSLRPSAIRRLLSMRVIKIWNPRVLHSLHAFIAADATTRAPRIRGLDIDDLRPSSKSNASKLAKEVARKLLDLLAWANNLRYLNIRAPKYIRHLDLLRDRRLLPALSRWTALQELTCQIGSDHTDGDFLRFIQSPLKILRLHGYINWTPELIYKYASHLAPTLEYLELGSAIGLWHRFDGSTSSPLRIQFPAMRSFVVLSDAGIFARLDILMELFPNLDETLHFSGDKGLLMRNQLREENTRAQEYRSWTRLRHLICSSEGFYSLALLCLITKVTVWDVRPDTAHCITQRLHHNPVPRLALTVFYWKGFDALRDLLPVTCALTTTHLSLFLRYDPNAMLLYRAAADGVNFTEYSTEQLVVSARNCEQLVIRI